MTKPENKLKWGERERERVTSRMVEPGGEYRWNVVEGFQGMEERRAGGLGQTLWGVLLRWVVWPELQHSWSPGGCRAGGWPPCCWGEDRTGWRERSTSRLGSLLQSPDQSSLRLEWDSAQQQLLGLSPQTFYFATKACCWKELKLMFGVLIQTDHFFQQGMWVSLASSIAEKNAIKFCGIQTIPVNNFSQTLNVMYIHWPVTELPPGAGSAVPTLPGGTWRWCWPSPGRTGQGGGPWSEWFPCWAAAGGSGPGWGWGWAGEGGAGWGGAGWSARCPRWTWRGRCDMCRECLQHSPL